MNNGSPTCGTCRHWHAGPINPMALDAPKQGDCREAPPGVSSFPAGMIAPQSIQTAAYPRLPENFPACSHHAPKPVEIA